MFFPGRRLARYSPRPLSPAKDQSELCESRAWADLSQTDLSGADLIRTDLSHATLRETDLGVTRLMETCFLYAKLERAVLTNARLERNVFTHAVLDRVDVRGIPGELVRALIGHPRVVCKEIQYDQADEEA